MTKDTATIASIPHAIEAATPYNKTYPMALSYVEAITEATYKDDINLLGKASQEGLVIRASAGKNSITATMLDNSKVTVKLTTKYKGFPFHGTRYSIRAHNYIWRDKHFTNISFRRYFYDKQGV